MMKHVRNSLVLRGRPTKLTDAVAAKIAQAMARGYFLESAAYLADVSPRTVQRWMAKGKKHPGYGVYGKFFLTVKKAIAECQGQMHEALVREGEKDWTALAWLMERRWPKQYGRKQLVNIEDNGERHKQMTLEQLIRWAERIEAPTRLSVLR